MKILYLITKSEAGGAQTHVAQLCRAFRDAHNIVVVAAPGGWLQDQCKLFGVSFISNPYFSNNILRPFRLIKSVSLLKSIIKHEKPDVVHCHSSVAGFLGRFVVRNTIPTVYTAHGWGFNVGVGLFQKWMAIIAEKWMAQYATKIICVSQFVKDLALKYQIAPENKLRVIYNGVELSPAHTQKADKTFVRITFVGRLAKPKRPELLLETVDHLKTSLRDTMEVTIIGDGPQKTALQDYIQVKQLERIHLTGTLSREEVYARLQDSDIFVFLSDWEGFPMAILEAMSYSLPIIASDVGGINEMVLPQVNGILLSKNSIDELTTSIETLLTDTKKRQKMGKRSYQMTQERFTVDAMTTQVEQVYRDLLR